jgi:hypothetical protein
MATNEKPRGVTVVKNPNAWRNSLQYTLDIQQNRNQNNMAGQGRKVSPLTVARKNSTDARTTLKAMVASYCETPTPKKAKFIVAQLEKVEEAERTIREEKAASETSLFGSDGEDEVIADIENAKLVDMDEEETDEEEETEEKEEKTTPVIPRPVTARDRNRSK